MTDLRKAVEMALEAFELLDRRGGLGLDVHEYLRTKIEALRQALAQPEHQTVSAPQPQTFTGQNPFNAPPKREWVGLTADELNMIGDSMRTWNSHSLTDVYVAIEAKLKEKNL